MKEPRPSAPAAEPNRVLILGGGFGGVYAAFRLEKLLARHDNLEVTLVTRDNYFLFTPMLPEVAAADFEQSTIVNPVRRLLKRVKSFVGSIDAIDLAARHVTVSPAISATPMATWTTRFTSALKLAPVRSNPFTEALGDPGRRLGDTSVRRR